MSVTRIRKHVNPLSRAYLIEASVSDWSEVFETPDLPLHFDIGCGKGKYLLALAQKNKDWNYLGTEIRKPLVDRANQWVQSQGLKNLHYIQCNINVSFKKLLENIPKKQLKRISIQFPDPWVKKKQIKRRIVTQALVEEMAEIISPKTEVFIQSDVAVVAQDMREHFQNVPSFKTLEDHMPKNPYGLDTEWERDAKKCGRKIFRTLYSL